MIIKRIEYSKLTSYMLAEFVYSFDCAFFKSICLQDVGKGREQEWKLCLIAKGLHRMAGFCSCKTSILYVLYITMHSFLIGATKLEKDTLNMPFTMDDLWCKRVNDMDGVYSAFAGTKSYQLRILG